MQTQFSKKCDTAVKYLGVPVVLARKRRIFMR